MSYGNLSQIFDHDNLEKKLELLKKKEDELDWMAETEDEYKDILSHMLHQLKT